ncbi:DUF4185 domain-containing protein [Jiangella anatolica]|uniref:Carbohydrate-binding protein n=1 Tax=Jiangella anatolica TaxID=2670374 RepID=A0A2W2BKJ5_9ACTN|nr:DUF4185 domain-containing protein [Jiangella anatolica]PZF80874.1 carbohydrate-binding protein [Jiangella anatolica]
MTAGAAALTLAAAAAACSEDAGRDTAPVSVADDAAERPFVLTGVRDVTEVAQLTGPDAVNDTAAVAVAGTDLGSMVNVGDRTYFAFGDTFGERDPDSYGGQGGFWRSNVMAFSTDDDASDGIAFDGWITDEVGLAAEIVPGLHEPDGTGEVTKIPTYGFAVDGAMYLYFMSVHHWGAPGEWDANYSALAKSTDDGQTWEVLDAPRWPGDSNFIQVATAHVAEDEVDHVYFWAIPAGRFGGVQLMKVPAAQETVEDPSSYRYFTGTDAEGRPVWSDDMNQAATIVDGTIGELSVMFNDYLDRWIMTYSDAGNAYVREGLTPWGPWGEPLELLNGAEHPGLYSPYLNPRYVEDGGRTVYFTLSLWGPYNVYLYRAELERAG